MAAIQQIEAFGLYPAIIAPPSEPERFLQSVLSLMACGMPETCDEVPRAPSSCPDGRHGMGHSEGYEGKYMKTERWRQSRGLAGFDLAGQSMSHREIRRNYVDYLWQESDPHGPFGVVVGNISGHGEDAALLLTSVRSFLRVLASRDEAIGRIVTEVNQYFALELQDNGWLISLLLLVLDPESRRIRWAGAGNIPALLYDPVRDILDELNGKNPAVGVEKTIRINEHCTDIPADGRLIGVISDGLWTRCDKTGQFFGKNRFREVIRTHAGGSAGDILDALCSEWQRFSNGCEPEGDSTLIVMTANAI